MVPAMDEAIDDPGIRRVAEQRFGPRAAELLIAAGWVPHRRIPEESLDEFDGYMRRLNEYPGAFDDATNWTLVEPAREVLREFGGLTLQVHRPLEVHTRVFDGTTYTVNGDWVPIRFYPFAGQDVDNEPFDSLPDDLGMPATPIAHIGANIRDEILMAADGRILKSDTQEYGGHCYCAPTFRDALPLICELRPAGYPLWILDEDGLFREKAILENVHFERTGRVAADPWPERQKQEAELHRRRAEREQDSRRDGSNRS